MISTLYLWDGGGYLPFPSNCSANCKGDLEYTCIIQVYQLYDTHFYVLGCEFSYWGGRYFHGHLVQETCKAGLTRSDHLNFRKSFNHTEKLVSFN